MGALHDLLGVGVSQDEDMQVPDDASTLTGGAGNDSFDLGANLTAADKIELKESSNVTIIGTGSGAVFDQLGIHIRQRHWL